MDLHLEFCWISFHNNFISLLVFLCFHMRVCLFLILRSSTDYFLIFWNWVLHRFRILSTFIVFFIITLFFLKTSINFEISSDVCQTSLCFLSWSFTNKSLKLLDTRVWGCLNFRGNLLILPKDVLFLSSDLSVSLYDNTKSMLGG